MDYKSADIVVRVQREEKEDGPESPGRIREEKYAMPPSRNSIHRALSSRLESSFSERRMFEIIILVSLVSRQIRDQRVVHW